MSNQEPIRQTSLSDDGSLWAELERIASQLTVEKGKALFQQGDAGRGVFLIRKGEVTLSIDSPSGGKLRYGKIGPGGILGLTAAISGAPYSLTAKCVGDCELSFIEAKQVVELLARGGDFGLQALEIMAEEVRQLRKKQASLLSMQLSN